MAGEPYTSANANRRSISIVPLMLALVFGIIGLGLAVFVAGRWWGAILPAAFAAIVPLWTQRREIKRGTQAVAQVGQTAAETVATAAAETAALANAPHDRDAPPTHSKRKRYAITLFLLALTIACTVMQLVTKQPDGWWLVAGCVPLCGMFFYGAWQWCRPKSNLRVLAAGAAMWSLGLSGNFTASAVTGGMCAQQAQTMLALPLKPITDGVTYLVAWTKKKDARDAAADARQAQMQQQLDDISRKLATSTGGDASSPLPALSAEEVTALERIATEGTPLQQAQAIIYLAADKRSPALWAQADAVIVRIEADRARGLWKNPAAEERYLLLKGDRLFLADDPDGAIAAYQVAVAAFPKSANAWNQLGRAEHNARQGDTKAHWAAARRACEMGLQVAPEGDSLIAALYNNLAVIQRDQGDLPGARANMERAIAIGEKLFAPNAPNFATYSSNLATIQKAQGDLAGARASMERAIAIAEKHLGAEHPDLATMRSNLATIQQDQSDLTGARANMERAIAIGEKHLGTDHPLLATYSSNLALIQKDQGDLTGARANMERAIAIGEKHLGTDHPLLATIYNNMQSILCSMGDYDDARKYMERAIAIDEKHFAPDDPTFATTSSNLATIQYNQGDLPGARASMERAIDIMAKHYGPDHPHLATAYNNLAHIAVAQDKISEAVELWRTCHAIRLKALGPDHPSTKAAAVMLRKYEPPGPDAR